MTKHESRNVSKLFQLKFYSFLSSRWGMMLCLIGAFVSFNTILHLVSMLQSSHNTNVALRDLADNIGGQPFSLSPEPIDAVYTWVNGSDPNLITAVAEIKRKLRDPNMPECKEKQDPNKHNCYRDGNSANRFVDNQELKYSLRSIEKYAPWIRHIYIVTNGQVPNWLNLDNPRISIVSHKDIFVNQSHLPSFASPSIESHLHRIPGLSKKFIYLNDDVMFGRPVYPDDFLTIAGQRVYLSWPVPNCNDGCPSNWVGDGFCDAACNVTMCDFDAGDCNNSTGTVKTRWWNRNNNYQNNNNISPNKPKSYCSRGCPDSWVGDKHCDRMCKNLECGFDAGDCGVDIMFQSSMPGYEITNQTLINIENGTYSVYFNLSTLIGNSTITDGSHDNAVLVRTATISQKNKIMTLTFHRNIVFQPVAITITWERLSDKETFTKDFNITLSTTDPSTETPSPTNSNTTTPITNITKKSTVKQVNNKKSNERPPPAVGLAGEVDDDHDNNDHNSPPQPSLTPSEEENATIDHPVEFENVNKLETSQGSHVLFELEEQVQPTPPDQGTNKNDDNGGGGRSLLSMNNIDNQVVNDDNTDDLVHVRYVDSNERNEMERIRLDEKETLEKKQRELKEDEQRTKDDGKSDYEKWYRLNRETERQLQEQGEMSFPWEEQQSSIVPGQRRTLDMFGDSLKFVNRLYTIEFGSTPRKVPAHMPHMIDVDIMNEMQQKWPEQWDATSSHQLRHPKDMQYAFSYFYYLIHKKKPFNMEKVWEEEIDGNRDGVVDLNELRNVGVMVYGTPLRSNYNEFKSDIYRSCLEMRQRAQFTQGLIDKLEDLGNNTIKVTQKEFDDCPITLEVLKSSNKTVELIEKAYAKRTFWRTTIEGTDEVAFVMVADNDTVSEGKLDGIRLKRHKFVCLNDDFDHDKPTAHLVVKVVQDFYNAMFPWPSSFELPPTQKNHFSYVDEIIEAKKDVKERSHGTFWFIAMVVVFVVVLVYKYQSKTKKASKKLFAV